MVGLVALIVVGPKKLPEMMRTAGEWVGRLRRMTSDMRAQTGIDDILREEGIDGVRELRTLLRGERVLGAKQNARAYGYEAYSETPDPAVEFPTEGPDALGALPDDLLADTEGQVTSPESTVGSAPQASADPPPPLVPASGVTGPPAPSRPPAPSSKPPAPRKAPTAPLKASASLGKPAGLPVPSNGATSGAKESSAAALPNSLPPPPVPARRLHSRAVTIPETPRSKSDPSLNQTPAVSNPKTPPQSSE